MTIKTFPSALCLWLVLCATTLNAQTDTATSTPHPSFATETPRLGQLFFSVGAEYRWAEHFTLPALAQSLSRGLDTQDMNVGSALFYQLDYYISERISLGFSHAFRYDHIADLSENSGDTQAIVPDQYGLIMDYHLYLSYHFQLFQKQAFFVQLGISRLNNAPIIRKTPRSIVSGSTSLADNLSLDPRDSATRFALGIEKKKFNLIAGLYYSKEHPYYDAGSYIVPYFQFNYRLGK